MRLTVSLPPPISLPQGKLVMAFERSVRGHHYGVVAHIFGKDEKSTLVEETLDRMVVEVKHIIVEKNS